MAVTNADPAVVQSAHKLTPLQGLGVLMGVIVAIAGYLAISIALKNQDSYGGFLFLLSWSALEQGKIDKLPHVTLGAILGLALGFLLHTLVTGSLGPSGALIFVAVMLPVVYCQIMGWLSIFINMTTMVFLTVTAIPYVQAHGDFHQLAEALAIGILYFGAILAVVARLSERAARRA
jgi:hypothetical protein